MAIVDSATQSMLTYFIPDSPFVDPEKHLDNMKKYDVDLQVLNVNPPRVDRIKDPEEAYLLCKTINDSISELVEKNKGSFAAMASIPFNHPELAVQEIKKVSEKLDLSGLVMPSNKIPLIL